MKIRINSTGFIHFDCKTTMHGGSAVNQFTGDPLTEVYYGDLHVTVTLYDLAISIEMNSVSGEWKNPVWAREQAMAMILKNLSMDNLIKIMAEMRILGRKEGEEIARSGIRAALGINNHDNDY